MNSTTRGPGRCVHQVICSPQDTSARFQPPSLASRMDDAASRCGQHHTYIVALALSEPWTNLRRSVHVFNKYLMSPAARHGSSLALTRTCHAFT